MREGVRSAFGHGQQRLVDVSTSPCCRTCERGIETGYRASMPADAEPDADDPAGLIEHPPKPPVRKVHHLNCVTMCPLGASLYNAHERLVGHCLLIETEA